MASSDNSRGAIYMSLAMASFTCNDALVKSVTASLSVAQIITVRGVMTTVLVYFVAPISKKVLSRIRGCRTTESGRSAPRRRATK